MSTLLRQRMREDLQLAGLAARATGSVLASSIFGPNTDKSQTASNALNTCRSVPRKVQWLDKTTRLPLEGLSHSPGLGCVAGRRRFGPRSVPGAGAVGVRGGGGRGEWG